MRLEDARSQPRIQLIPALPGAAGHFPGSPPRGNWPHSAAARSSRLWTLPSILRPGFRSLSAPNNAALAKHLPQADRAPAGGLAAATRSRSALPAIVQRGSAVLRDKRQQRSSPEGSQRCQPQHALKTAPSQPHCGVGGSGKGCWARWC